MCEWKPIKLEQKKLDMITKDGGKTELEVYDLGTRFYYWKSMKQHPHFIAAKYSNLKEEMFQSGEIDGLSWTTYKMQCNNLRKINKIRTIVSNGFHKTLYGINENEPMDSQHLLAVKFYTDSSNLCSLLTNTLRSRDAEKNITNCKLDEAFDRIRPMLWNNIKRWEKIQILSWSQQDVSI
eukprot:264939_1